MPPAKERVLALIVREAVTNILRHSQAKKCRLALFRAEGAYRLEIADDGRGGTHEEGIGMRSIPRAPKRSAAPPSGALRSERSSP